MSRPTGPPTRIGLATPRDARRIAETHVRARRAAYRGLIPEAQLAAESVDRRTQQWEDRLADDAGRCFLLHEGDVLLGFAHTAPARDEDLDPGSTAELFALYLVPKGIGRGLGRLLADHAMDDLRTLGFTEVVLWFAEENAPVARFYAAAGFETDPRVPPVPFGATELTKRRLRRGLG